jgi:hypothetical protein
MRDDLRRFVMLLMLGLTVLFAPWVLAQDDTAPPQPCLGGSAGDPTSAYAD